LSLVFAAVPLPSVGAGDPAISPPNAADAGADREGADAPDAQSGNPRLDRRKTVLFLGATAADSRSAETSPKRGPSGQSAAPLPDIPPFAFLRSAPPRTLADTVREKRPEWRVVDRIQVSPPMAGPLGSKEPAQAATGVYLIRKTIFSALYDVRLGRVAAVVLAPGETHSDPGNAFEGRTPEAVFRECIEWIRIHRKTLGAKVYLVAGTSFEGETNKAILAAAEAAGVEAVRGNEGDQAGELCRALAQEMLRHPDPEYAEWFEQGILLDRKPVCTANEDRSPLRSRDGRQAGAEGAEGRRILLDCDSYPREPANFAVAPRVEKREGGWEISFALDRPDDVLVRIVDPAGRNLRVLACGVLGSNAPVPLAEGSLSQKLAWDGNDAGGKAVPGGTRVEVGIGLAPRFAGFLGYRPGQLLGRLLALAVDPSGRVYVAMDTGGRYDMSMARFDRAGQYLDMVYPSDPKAMPAPLEDIYPFACAVDGRAVPTLPRAWPCYIYPKGLTDQNGEGFHGLPFCVDGKGRGWLAEIGTGLRAFGSRPDSEYRVFGIPDLDKFWFLQTMCLLECVGAFAVDERGYGYLAWRSDAKVGFSKPALNNARLMGTILKVELATGKPAHHFTFNGRQRRAAPDAVLGQPQRIAVEPLRKRNAPDPAVDDESHFPDIRDLDVDAQGRLLVVDGYPRRIKAFGADGLWLGEITGVTLDGKQCRFENVHHLRAGKDCIYAIVSLPSSGAPKHLIKMSGDIASPRAVWSVPLPAGAAFLAVDRFANPPHVWTGNGAGERTLARFTDKGDQVSDALVVGGLTPGVIAKPGGIAANGEKRIFLMDDERGVLASCLPDGSEWREAPVKLPVRNLLADPWRDRVLVARSGSPPQCMDGELTARPIGPAGATGIAAKTSGGYGITLVGMDPDGSFFVREEFMPDGVGFGGAIRKRDPGGQLTSNEVCSLWHQAGGAARDSKGNFYAMDLCASKFQRVVHDFPVRSMGAAEYENMGWCRGTHTVRHQSELGYLTKFGPSGGVRNTESEIWAHRGFSPIPGGRCHCDWPANLVAVDAADRVYAADNDHFHVKALDANGNLIARIGRWGGAQTVPKAGESAGDLGFAYIYGLSARGDELFVVDRVLRRVSRVLMGYRRTVSVELPL
jgi:hypothetical protein